MRTTVRLDDELLASAKRSAAESGRTLTAVIEDALREALSRRTGRTGSPRIRLTTVGGNGLRPGIDLDDTAGLLELMDGSRGSA